MLRTSTERPEAVESGYAKVMGFDILEEMEAHRGRPSEEHPYGTGDGRRDRGVPRVVFSFIGSLLGPAVAMYPYQNPYSTINLVPY